MCLLLQRGVFRASLAHACSSTAAVCRTKGPARNARCATDAFFRGSHGHFGSADARFFVVIRALCIEDTWAPVGRKGCRQQMSVAYVLAPSCSLLSASWGPFQFYKLLAGPTAGTLRLLKVHSCSWPCPSLWWGGGPQPETRAIPSATSGDHAAAPCCLAHPFTVF